MGQRKETTAPFPHKDPLFEQVEEEDLQVALKAEEKERAPVDYADGDGFGLEIGVQCRRKVGRALIQLFIGCQSQHLHLGQRRLGGRHGQGMFAEGAAEKDRLFAGDRVIAILPHTAVNIVHDRGLAGDNADRHAATGDLAIGGQIGLDPIPGLRPAWVDAKTADHLVKDEDDAGLFGQLTQRMDKLDRL